MDYDDIEAEIRAQNEVRPSDVVGEIRPAHAGSIRVSRGQAGAYQEMDDDLEALLDGPPPMLPHSPPDAFLLQTHGGGGDDEVCCECSAI